MPLALHADSRGGGAEEQAAAAAGWGGGLGIIASAFSTDFRLGFHGVCVRGLPLRVVVGLSESTVGSWGGSSRSQRA
jgi:hypothetical protein